jgi:hypothetical protein
MDSSNDSRLLVTLEGKVRPKPPGYVAVGSFATLSRPNSSDFLQDGHSAFDMNLKRRRGTGERLYRAGALVDRALNLPELE